jgi:protein-tyrosine phosphatase
VAEIVIVCTANQCRSPIASELLATKFAQRGAPFGVATMGFLEGGVAVASEVLRAAAPFGIGLEGHVSRTLDMAEILDADLVLTMTRRQLRELVVLEPSVWSRTFTMIEIVRRGGSIGPRPQATSVSAWIEQAHRGREMVALLVDDPTYGVPDPTGGGRSSYAEMMDVLSALTSSIVELLWPNPAELA